MRTASAGNKNPVEGDGAGEFVSRAEGKLAGAVKAFKYDFRGKTVLDVGSSTGGFTELALKLGARKVVAVEKGTKQMKAPLRFDKRIELYEKTDVKWLFLRARLEDDASAKNFANIKRLRLRAGLDDTSTKIFAGRSSRPSSRGLSLSPRRDCGLPAKILVEASFDVVLADVSFTSLRPILVHVRDNLAGEGTDFLVMLKPQFEARPEQLWRGVVKNEKTRREIIKDFESWLKNNGFVIKNKRDNDLAGKSGNQERFYFLKMARRPVGK